jgi:hypothetical protein
MNSGQLQATQRHHRPVHGCQHHHEPLIGLHRSSCDCGSCSPCLLCAGNTVKLTARSEGPASELVGHAMSSSALPDSTIFDDANSSTPGRPQHRSLGRFGPTGAIPAVTHQVVRTRQKSISSIYYLLVFPCPLSLVKSPRFRPAVLTPAGSIRPSMLIHL